MKKLQQLIDAINLTRQTRGEGPLDVTADDITAEILEAANAPAPAAKKKSKD